MQEEPLYQQFTSRTVPGCWEGMGGTEGEKEVGGERKGRRWKGGGGGNREGEEA